MQIQLKGRNPARIYLCQVSDKTSFSPINCQVCVRRELIQDRMENDNQAIDSQIQGK